jgi:hypothetical protein
MGQFLARLMQPEGAEAEIEALRAALRVSEEGRLASEAGRLASEKARLASELAGFMDRMRAISNSHSGDTLSNTDVILRGATEAALVPLETLMETLPKADTKTAAAAWAALRKAHSEQWRPPRLPIHKPLSENRHVHPTIARVLHAALKPSAAPLQLWCNATAEHELVEASVRPDFTLTHLRDASPSTMGALLMVEVKLPGEIENAVTQACIYLRRRIYRLCKEANARGEAMDALFALGVATDGQYAVVLRMRSGAPPAGSELSFALAEPCPVQRTPLLPLLGNWDFRARSPHWFSSPSTPKGFVALARLLAAPVGVLAVDTLLTHLDVHVGPPSQTALNAASGASAASNAAGGGGAAVLEERPLAHLLLGVRLGSGGTSDVYKCSAEVGVFAGMDEGGTGLLCVKVARVCTPLVQACFAQEARALQLLAEAGEGSATQAGLVPRLVAVCSRLHQPAWPLLLLWPAGESLGSWVEACVREEVTGGGGGGGGGEDGDQEEAAEIAAETAAAAVVRARCATAVVLRILLALEAGANAGLVHCDVRPSNIVIGPDGLAVLVDWGISRAVGAESKGCGVSTFADKRIFSQTTYAARPGQDVYGALLTWVCIARGIDCTAPWPRASERGAWLSARAARGDVQVARVCQALEAVAKVRGAAKVLAIAREALGEL